MNKKLVTIGLLIVLLSTSCVGTAKTRHGSVRGKITPNGVLSGFVHVVGN